ncbi:hypothetical protein E4U47_007140, partial [Claviceps purpurea]
MGKNARPEQHPSTRRDSNGLISLASITNRSSIGVLPRTGRISIGSLSPASTFHSHRLASRTYCLMMNIAANFRYGFFEVALDVRQQCVHRQSQYVRLAGRWLWKMLVGLRQPRD